MTHTTEELERPAWGVWVDYKIAPPGSYACLVSRFMDNRWTDPEPQWMPAQLRPQLYGEVKVMPYLMPNDPLAAVNALPELVALRKENERLQDRLSEIGAFAHDSSTGPAIPDAFWSIRDMAYGALETSAERTERIKREVSLEARAALSQEAGS